MIQRMKGNCIFNKYPAQLCIVDGNLSFSLAHKMIMSDQRGRKRSSYKRWLYDSDQSKPKVTKWREKKNASLSHAERDKPRWIDNSIEFEEISLGDCHNHAFDLEEFFVSSTSQFSDVCEMSTIVLSSED